MRLSGKRTFGLQEFWSAVTPTMRSCGIYCDSEVGYPSGTGAPDTGVGVGVGAGAGELPLEFSVGVRNADRKGKGLTLSISPVTIYLLDPCRLHSTASHLAA